ncbi:hypothetical protein ACU4HD_19695 [Cupriavidus basilensis]
MLATVDRVVQYLEKNLDKSAGYGGSKFSLMPCPNDIPWGNSEPELVFANNARALHAYSVLLEFYYLLLIPQYWVSQYCVSLEAARQALFTVYPNGFQELPLTEYLLSQAEPGSEGVREFTKLAWPTAERFNLVVDKLAEIVSGSGYRSKLAREKAKLKQRTVSVTNLIEGLLRHHKSLTVVAVRLSIRQKHGRNFIGDKMQKALNSLIGDRRNDAILSQAVGYFWVLQESFGTHFGQHPAKLKKLNIAGDISLHYDLVMFFDAIRWRETEAISRHIGECWKVITDQAGFCRLLSGNMFNPRLKSSSHRHTENDGESRWITEFTGLVNVISTQAVDLKTAAKLMVRAAVLRKPQNETGPLIRSSTRRFGKSDLLTGCGFDKARKENLLKPSSETRARKMRPKYVAPDFP